MQGRHRVTGSKVTGRVIRGPIQEEPNNDLLGVQVQ